MKINFIKKLLLLVLFLSIACLANTSRAAKCTKYNIGSKLPKYLLKNGYMLPCVEKNFGQFGILVRVDATPEAGKVITKSHGELIGGKWVEIIDEQKAPEDIAAEKALAVNKFSKLHIVRAMRALGKSSNLQALLNSKPIFKEDWDAAIEIDLSDPVTQQAITAYGGNINEIKLKIAELKKGE